MPKVKNPEYKPTPEAVLAGNLAVRLAAAVEPAVRARLFAELLRADAQMISAHWPTMSGAERERATRTISQISTRTLPTA